nr:hypothetical protein GCM10020093_056990 [Planobispora longispora]
MVSTRDLPKRRAGLRIAMIAPPWYEVPPRGYGGIESMLAELVDGLSRRGHEVTLIGVGRTETSARFLPTYERPPSERIGEALPELVHAARAHELVSDLDTDIVHDHSMAGPLMAAARCVPTVITCHGDVDGELADYYRALGGEVSVVAISEAQRRAVPDLNWAGVVHNAVKTDSFPFREDKEDWVLWLGRFNHDKGAHLAIDVVRETGGGSCWRAGSPSTWSRSTSTSRSSRASARTPSTSARPTRCASASCCRPRAACSSRSSGRSRSAWS